MKRCKKIVPTFVIAALCLTVTEKASAFQAAIDASITINNQTSTQISAISTGATSLTTGGFCPRTNVLPVSCDGCTFNQPTFVPANDASTAFTYNFDTSGLIENDLSGIGSTKITVKDTDGTLICTVNYAAGFPIQEANNTITFDNCGPVYTYWEAMGASKFTGYQNNASAKKHCELVTNSASEQDGGYAVQINVFPNGNSNNVKPSYNKPSHKS